MPELSFPLTDARKSGWLPPSINLDTKSGLELAVPYYWNIAPQRDATLTPVVYTRRGLGLGSEFRYLEPQHHGELQLHALPNRSRVRRLALCAAMAADRDVHGATAVATPGAGATKAQRVSDDTYWKDFPSLLRTVTPRLLPLSASLERDWTTAGLQSTTYARTQDWQVLQDADPLALITRALQPRGAVRLARRRALFAVGERHQRRLRNRSQPLRAGPQRRRATASRRLACARAGQRQPELAHARAHG